MTSATLPQEKADANAEQLLHCVHAGTSQRATCCAWVWVSGIWTWMTISVERGASTTCLQGA